MGFCESIGRLAVGYVLGNCGRAGKMLECREEVAMNTPTKAGPHFDASLNILKQIAKTVENCHSTVHAYIAGGQAMAFWCNGFRMSLDLDVIFSHKMLVEQGLHAFVAAENPLDAQRVDFDYNFNDTFSLIHSDYPKRATFVQSYGKLTAHIISPVDLALMKISRFSERDRNDIKELVREGLIDRDELKELANDALNDYVGNTEVLRTSLDIVLTWFPSAEQKKCHRLRP